MIELLAVPAFFNTLAFLLGLCLGSFYNVCVHRYLVGQSVVFPASHCPACKHELTWWENIPVISFLFLKGRCRSCRMRIHWRYPALELLSGILCLLFADAYGFGISWLFYTIFCGVFLVASFIDLDSFILPDVLTYPAGVLALFSPLFLNVSIIDTVLGSVFGAGSFLLLQQFYVRVRKIDALGMGDVKLMVSLGALVGVSQLPVMILLSASSALLASIIYIRRPSAQGMRTAIPFGPFLCLGAILTLIFGNNILLLFVN